MIAPRESNRVRPPTHDDRVLHRYRCWKVERANVWLQNFRHIAARLNYYAENYLNSVQLDRIEILLKCYL